MLLRNVFTKTLWDARRSLLGWAIGVAGVSMMYAGFYPSMRSPGMAEAMKSYPEALKKALQAQDITTPAGYLQSTVFGVLGPLLIVIFAVATGARAVAGDEETGTLEVLLAHPVGRVKLVLQRAASLAVSTAGLGAVALLALLVISGPAQLDLGTDRLAAAVLQLVLLGIVFGAVALAVGGVVGRRGTVIAVTGAVGVLTYVANVFAAQSDSLRWMRTLSPFHYYSGGEPLRQGFQAADAGVLAAASLVLIGIAALAFNRRDVGV